MHRRAVLGSAVAGISSISLARAAETVAWPSWRGPTRDGMCAGQNWSKNLDGLKLEWSVDLADSYSGPIVAGGKVFTTETVGKRDETLIAFDVESGNEVWKQAWAGAMTVPFFAKANGDWIRSTPATDGEYVIVGGMKDVVAAFDAESGQEQWRIDFVKDHGAALPPFGLVCSPAIVGDSVYMQAGGAVRCIDRKTGELKWECLPDDGGMSGGAFSSPTIATIHGKEQLVVQTRTTLGGVDMKTGAVLWQRDIAAFRGMNILTPTVWKDCVFTSSYGGKAQLIEFNTSSTPWSTSVKWENKAEAYMSSPLVVGDYLYMHLKNNRCCCLDLNTGEEKWRTTPFGKYWSMLSDGSTIIALDERGELILVEATPDAYVELARKQITDQQAWAHIAVHDGRIFVRRQRGLDVYSWA
ncbi:MAG: PQQ-binding-like beta-propeller repeat protein [Aureliella sp.]